MLWGSLQVLAQPASMHNYHVRCFDTTSLFIHRFIHIGFTLRATTILECFGCCRCCATRLLTAECPDNWRIITRLPTTSHNATDCRVSGPLICCAKASSMESLTGAAVAAPPPPPPLLPAAKDDAHRGAPPPLWHLLILARLGM